METPPDDTDDTGTPGLTEEVRTQRTEGGKAGAGGREGRYWEWQGGTVREATEAWRKGGERKKDKKGGKGRKEGRAAQGRGAVCVCVFHRRTLKGGSKKKTSIPSKS